MGTYDIVIAGGGIAGLTAACYAARAGRSTLLLERAGKTGGLAADFACRGFTFDAGVRAFENAGMLLPMLRQLGIELPLVDNPVSVHIQDESVDLLGPDALAEYGALLQRATSAPACEVRAVIDEIRNTTRMMQVIYGIDNPLFDDGKKDSGYLRSTLLPWFLSYRKTIRSIRTLQMPVRAYLKRFTSSTALIDIVTQHFFTDTPAFFALSYWHMYQDYRYPLGGTGALARALTSFAEQNGAHIRRNEEVRSVDRRERRVHTTGGRWNYRQLIWACDQRSLYERTVPLSSAGQRQKEKVRGARGGDSVITAYLGLDLSPEKTKQVFGPHVFYTPDPAGLHTGTDPSRQPDESALEAYLRYTTYEISIPCLRDPALAPPGKTGLIVSTLMHWKRMQAAAEHMGYDAIKDIFLKHVIRLMCWKLAIPAEAVLFSFCATPRTLARRTGNTDGAITGWSFEGPSPSEYRFEKMMRAVRTPFPDMLQCGQWTFRPGGVPVALLTGKVAADRAVKKTEP